MDPRSHTGPRDPALMNTTQKTQKVIIAAAIIAASAGLALASCAGQRQLPEPAPDQLSEAQIAEQRAAYRDLAERRAEIHRYLGQAGAGLYLDQAERRADVTGPVIGESLRELAERQQQGLNRY
jgi:hypothetical protein